MSAPFAPGDVVVCVDAKPDRIDPLAARLVERAHYRVAVVGVHRDGGPAIGFRCLPSDIAGACWGWSARRFRKIDAADEQFAARIRACKPEREPC